MKSLGNLVVGLAIALAGCGEGVLAEETGMEVGAGEALAADGSAVMGSIGFGQTVSGLAFNCSPTYRALSFATTVPNQKVEIWARSADGNAIAWIANSSFSALARNDDADGTTRDSHIVHTLRKVASYYVVFKEKTCQAATFNVTLRSASCPARTCAEAGATCGTLPDGCGGTLDCGLCQTGEVCDAHSCRSCDACPVAGATDCAGGTLRTCAAGADGCLSWGSSTACASGQCASATACAAQDLCRDVACTQGERCDTANGRCSCQATTWHSLARFTMGAGESSLLYSDGVFDSRVSWMRYLRVSTGCPVEIETLRVQHWDAQNRKNVDLPVALFAQGNQEWTYVVNGAAGAQTVDNWLVKTVRRDTSTTCEVRVVATADCLQVAAPPTGRVDFCGNGLDEDGDGRDRSCVPYSGKLPVVRTVTIYDRGANEGIRVVPPGPIAFPEGAEAQLRLVNRSVWQVGFSGNLTPGWLDPNPDEITTSVGVPGRVKLSLPFEDLLLELVREPTAMPQPEPVVIEGSLTVSGRPPLSLRIAIRPDFGKQCPTGSNMASTIDECATYTSCAIQIVTRVEIIDPATGNVVTDYTFLPDQCDAYGESYVSSLRWDSATNALAIWNNWSNSTHSASRRLSLNGTPASLTGELSGIAPGLDGQVTASF